MMWAVPQHRSESQMKWSLACILLGITIVVSSYWISDKALPRSSSIELVGGVTNLGASVHSANALYWIGLTVVLLAVVHAAKSTLTRFMPQLTSLVPAQMAIQAVQMSLAYLGVVVAVRAGKGAEPLLLPSHLVGLVVILIAGLCLTRNCRKASNRSAESDAGLRT